MRLTILLLCLWPFPLLALEGVQISLGDLQGSGWSVEQAKLTLAWRDSQTLEADLQAQTASLPEPLGRLRALTLHCTELELAGLQADCRQGRLQGQSDLLGKVQARLHWTYHRDTGALNLSLQALETEAGRLDLQLHLLRGQWQVEAEIQHLSLAAVQVLVRPWWVFPGGLEVDGRVQGHLQLAGGAGLEQGSGQLRLLKLNYANTAGTQAGEGLGGLLDWQLEHRSTAWQLALQVRAEQGQLFSDPMFFEYKPAAPLQLETQLRWQNEQLDIQQLRWQHPDTLQLEASAQLQLGEETRLQVLDVQVQEARFPHVFSSYIQPWLPETSFADLATQGSFSGRLILGSNVIPSLQLDLRDIALDDPRGRIQWEGLSGKVDWADDDQVRQQQLRWSAGQLYRVALGAAQVDLQTAGRWISLAAPARLPVLDGSLQVESFEMQYGEALEWSLDAALTPISMPALTAALGWPEMAGTLSGMIPAVHYEGGDLRVGGALLVRVFDGDITVRNLRMEKPLGAVPRLWADVALKQMDLETLTRTFAFGRIEGRLDGHMEGLVLEAWRPVAFDARFATPENDRSRHRISQKAVDSIADIGGGGMAGALSRGFLRFLEDFPYKALGLSCRLRAGVCEMDGVAPAKQGYYLVQGRFLPPRIDVIGYERRVNWRSLLERLKTVTSGDAPVIK